MKECPSCNASVPESADVCPSCSLTFQEDEGDARKTLLGMSFAAEDEAAEDTEDDDGEEPAEELLFNLDFRDSKTPESTTAASDESDAQDEPLRVPDDASPTGTLRGTGSEATEAEEASGSADEDAMSANPATRTHDGLPEFEPGRVFGGHRARENASKGDSTEEGDEEVSARVEAQDLDSVRDAFRRRNQQKDPSEPTSDDEAGSDEGPRPDDFSGTPGSGIIRVPDKKDSEAPDRETELGHASEQSGSGIIKRPEETSTSDEPTDTDAGLDEDSDVVGDNTYMEGVDDDAEEVTDVRRTAQVADPGESIDEWSRADETAQIGPEAADASLTSETDVISEGEQRGPASWVALVAGLFWVIAADTIWMTASFEAAAVQVKFAAAMVGGVWGLFGPFLIAGRTRAYGHVVLGAVAGSAFAATLAVTGLALGDVAGLLGAIVLIVAGVLED